MYLTSMSDPGLVILPTHRVLGAGAGLHAAEVFARLRDHFALTTFARTARSEFLECLRRGQAHAGLGVVVAGAAELAVATLSDATLLERYAAHLAPVVRRLDVAVLDTVVLRGLMGIDCTAAAQEGHLTY